MKTWVHFAVSLIIAAILYPAFKWKVLFIFAGGILIDIDHYFWYIFKFRKLSLIGCYNFFIERMDKGKVKDIIGLLMVFHTLEFMITMILLSFYFESAMLFTIGLLSHYALDVIFLYSVMKRFVASPSIIYSLMKNFQKV